MDKIKDEVAINYERHPIFQDGEDYICLVTCTNSWVSEDSLSNSAAELIPSYWTSHSNIHEIIKIEDLEEEEEYKSNSCGTKSTSNYTPNYIKIEDDDDNETVSNNLNSMKIRKIGTEAGFRENTDLQQKEPIGFKKLKYQCHKCKLNFDKYDSLQLHINSPLPCTGSGKSNNNNYLSRHKSNERDKSNYVAGNIGYTCEICNLYFSEITDLDHHVILHSIERRAHEGQQSELSVEEEADLEKLRAIYNESEPFICPICCKGFSDNNTLQKHILLHNVMTFVCQKCNQTFSSKADLIKHELNHVRKKSSHLNGYSNEDRQHNPGNPGSLESLGRPFKCLTCGKEFAHRYYLRNHEKVHEGEKPYVCGVCYKRFSFVSQLDQHKSIAHCRDKQFTCDVCAKKFSTQNNLKVHEMIHRSELTRDYISNNKSRTITSPSNNHTEVSFLCSTCGKHFYSIAMLQEHEKIHIQHRPKTFKCVLCMKAFTKHCDLKRHIMTHTGEKPFKCEICTKAFTRNSHLKTHKMLHTGEKPFKCPSCSKGFTKRSDMKKHFMCHQLVTHSVQTSFA